MNGKLWEGWRMSSTERRIETEQGAMPDGMPAVETGGRCPIDSTLMTVARSSPQARPDALTCRPPRTEH
jgi:hypothetical protein